uniref:Uncharacterized protein n=1 Tax=viral metagenome TaxID=1070528 RepID=A0A6C0DR70_9ZZZZ
MTGKTKKQRAWAKWSKVAPTTHERTLMLQKCGKKCFLGTKKSFPICSRNTCKRNRHGVLAAYIRAKEYASIASDSAAKSKKHRPYYYKGIASRANRMMKKTRRLYTS